MNQYLRKLSSCQYEYDNMLEPEYFCKVCGREITCDCICDDETDLENDCD